MPDLSANRPTIRTDGHSIDLYFTPLIGVQIWTGTVASTPTFPANSLAITGGSGTIADVMRGMRVTIETSGGLFKGETHVRAAGTISATLIPIRETSKGTINIAAGDVIRVYNAIYLQDKLVSADASFSPDNLAYSAQNSTVPPIAISGGHFAAFVDSGQAYATIVFAGSESYTVDADSGGTVSHSWVFNTATGTTTSTSASPSFTFPVGYHIGSHTVTDSSNSAPWTQFIMGQVYDANTLPYECVVNGIEAAPDAGWSSSVQLFANATLTDIPDRCMGIVWSQETYAGTVQSFGNVIPSRSHIKMLGYVSRDNNRFDPVNSTLVFDLISPLARLAQLPGYSKVMLNTASPDKWREIDDLSVKRAVIVLLRYYTNLTEIYDFLYDADTYAFPRFYLQKNTPLAQVNELADGVDARFVTNRTGRFMVQKRQELTVLSDRAALTTTLTLTTEDIADYDFSRDHFRVVEQLELRGFIAHQTDPTPIFARWPGLGPGQGTQASVTERIIAASQADLNRRAGLRGAALDGVFIDSALEYRKTFDIRLTLRGAYDVFDFYREWIALDIDGTTNLRGVDLRDTRFTFQGVSISYDHSTSTAVTDLTLRAETAAPAGVKYSPTLPISSNTPDYTPPDLDIGFTPVPDATILLPPEDGETLPIQVFALNRASNQAAIALSYDSGAGTIAWVEVSTGLTGNGMDARSDPYNPGRYFALTADGLFQNEGPFDLESWSLVANNAAIFGLSTRVGHKMEMSINRRGWMMIASGNSYAVSFDYGLTWTQVSPTGAASWGTGFSVQSNDMVVSPFNNPNASNQGYVYAGIYTGGSTYAFYRSTDWGLTWTARSTGVSGTSLAPRMSMPYHDAYGNLNVNSNVQETWIIASSTSVGVISRDNSAGARTDVTVVSSGAVGGVLPQAGPHRPLSCYTYGLERFYCGASVVAAYGIFADPTGASIAYYNIGGAGSHQGMCVQGWPSSPYVAIMWSIYISSALKITLDGGVTRFGNSPAFFTGSGISYCELSLIDVVPPS